MVTCRECGSDALLWQFAVNYDNNGHGRPNCVMFLGCETCSETLEIIDEERLIAVQRENETKRDLIALLTELENG